jgi:hypothetical protein
MMVRDGDKGKVGDTDLGARIPVAGVLAGHPPATIFTTPATVKNFYR